VTPGDDEARLRAALAEAHREDTGRTPSFEATWAAARRSTPRRSTWRWAVAGAGLAAAAAGVWLVVRAKPPPASPILGTRWVGPTDFLLQTPDLMTLRTLPPLDPAADPWTARPPAPRGNP
jgi:hypothetical protein